MIEINGNPNRRDLNEHHARMAAEAGVTIVCNTDAHRISTLAYMVYGVATARRAGLTEAQVANTRDLAQLQKLKRDEALAGASEGRWSEAAPRRAGPGCGPA